jgi:AcrR family transcriptional regulator
MTYDERLERLLSTAAAVFAAKGFHPTTMRDLSRATGMSLAGMYYYVQGKEELLALIQERCFQRVLEGAQETLESSQGADGRLRGFIRHHVTYFAEHMDEMKVLSHEAESLSPQRQRPIDQLKRHYVNLLLSLLADAFPSADARVERRAAAYGLFGMMNWIYTWYDPEGAIAPGALAEQFTELFLHGVTPAAPSGAAAAVARAASPNAPRRSAAS